MCIVVCNGNITVYPSGAWFASTDTTRNWMWISLILSEAAQSSLSVSSIISYNTSMTRNAALVRKTLAILLT